MRRFTVLVRAAEGVGGWVFGLPYLSHPPPPLPSPLGLPRSTTCWLLTTATSFSPGISPLPPPRQPGEPRSGWIWQPVRGAGAPAGRQANCCRCCCSKDTFLVSNGLPACRSSHHFQRRHQRKYMCEQAKKPEATRALMPLDDSGVESENMSKHLVVSLI